MRSCRPRSTCLPSEHQMLARWDAGKVFERSLDQTAAGEPAWVFYEGPPTANGNPGTHHVEARVFKDLFPRFKTMQGPRAPPGRLGLPRPAGRARRREGAGLHRQAGDIEAYGVAEFNARCRESVLRHVDEFERLTERMGYWVDMSQAYRTMDTSYVESVWWSLKPIFDKGLLVQDHRVAPYCPRCGTGLSDHEVAQGYQTVADPSVYVRFPVTSGPLQELGAALLVWTTTPWTLVTNTAVAVHPDVDYVVSEAGRRQLLVVAGTLLQLELGEDVEVLERIHGAELEHTTYARPFDSVPRSRAAHYVGLADYVTIEDGTGLVHQAPAFGAEDLEVARRYGLPVVNPVRPDGTFEEDLPLVGGMFFKKADAALVAVAGGARTAVPAAGVRAQLPALLALRHRAALLRAADLVHPDHGHQGPADRGERQDRLAPGDDQDGRYGDWLDNNVDWALSRNRYWGTPLPVWRCPDDHLTCVGSLAELGALAGRGPGASTRTGPTSTTSHASSRSDRLRRTSRRVPEVIDGWYDSGSMPFAQFGYPRSAGSEPGLPGAVHLRGDRPDPRLVLHR